MNLIGIHDIEGFAITPDNTWILDTVALSENDAGKIYSPTKNWIVRLNWGYGSTGTIPLDIDKQNLFFSRMSRYITQSSGCSRWIIGNEPNLPREWPDGKSIFPYLYANFFKRCRQIIKNLSGHHDDEVLVAGSGCWNAEFKYPGNPSGDWIQYYIDTINFLEGAFDGFAIHAYTHGYDPALAYSDTTMDPPFAHRYYHFRVYRDYVNAVPEKFSHLPTYITEANGDGPWQASGLMLAMADEINQWNAARSNKKRLIKSLIFYRYPKFDQGILFNIEGKPDVIAEYKKTAEKGYVSPVTEKTFIPSVHGGEKRKGVVTIGLLNVRNSPGVFGTEIVGSRSLGNEIEIYEEKLIEGVLWYRIGENAWIISKYVQLEGESSVPEKDLDETERWHKSLDFVLRWEGGWSEDPNDPGGATMKGITLETYTNWRKSLGQPEPTKNDLRNITDQEVATIYKEWYWKPSGADKLSWPLCLAVFDLAVNGGVGKSNEFKQEVGLNFNLFMARRLDWYTRLDTFVHFGKGWIRRCADLMRVAN